MIPFAALGVLALAAIFYFLSRQRAIAAAGDVPSSLHSRPSYHGFFAAEWVLLIGIGSLLIAATLSDSYIASRLATQLAETPRAELVEAGLLKEGEAELAPIQRDLILRDARALGDGKAIGNNDAVRAALGATAQELSELRSFGVSGLALTLALVAGVLCWRSVGREFRARNRSERVVRYVLLAAAVVAILTTLGILVSLIGETLIFFDKIDWEIGKFLFGTNWNPLANQRAVPAFVDKEDVGWLPLLAGTMMITAIAMMVAVPIGLMTAIYLSDYASGTVRAVVKPVLEVLAGIPTVVYGFFAAITVAPFIRGIGEAIGLDVSGQSALAAGIVMGVMIIPFISSLSDDVINAVPQSLRDGSYGLGATRAETIRKVVLPAALPGIISAVILGVSRAVGETMIVVMAAGQGPNLTWNPLESVTTVTVQIVMLITGDTEADLAAGPAFTLGFALFTVTLLLNIAALRIVRKYRERYD